MAWLIFYVSTYISSFGCVLWIGLIDPNFFLTSDPRMSDWREVLCICAEYVCMYVCMYGLYVVRKHPCILNYYTYIHKHTPRIYAVVISILYVYVCTVCMYVCMWSLFADTGR